MELQVLPSGQLQVQGRLLENDADLTAQGVAVPGHGDPGHFGMAGSGTEQSGEDIDNGGFAGAVGAQQAEQLAFRNGES